MIRATLEHLADVFALADAEAVTLWRDGGAISFRAAGELSPELRAGLHAHRAAILEALSRYPAGRREPGADDELCTARSEAALAALPEPLRDFERQRWLADLSAQWSRGASGRKAAEAAHAQLIERIAAHRSAAGEEETDSDAGSAQLAGSGSDVIDAADSGERRPVLAGGGA